MLLSTVPANTPLLFPFPPAAETLAMQLPLGCPVSFSWVLQPSGKGDAGDAEVNETQACSAWLTANVLETG